jgi:hypothetical protein
MIKKQLGMLTQRREELIGRSDAQREALALQAHYLVYSLAGLETAIAVLRSIKKKPAILAGLAVGLILIKPRRLFNFVRTGAVAWKAWGTVAPLLQTLLARRRQ